MANRENILQETATKNQEFQSTCKSLNSFLDNLPENQINYTDDLSQVTTKQSSQEVETVSWPYRSVTWRVVDDHLSAVIVKQ